MIRWFKFCFAFIIFFLSPELYVESQELNPRKPEITSPSGNDVVRGLVTIVGNSDVEGLSSWEVSFGYAEDTTETWFLIDESDLLVTDEILTEWDTTTISDGNYNLRLSIILEGERRIHFTVNNLRVRNYSQVETNTPNPTTTITPVLDTPDHLQDGDGLLTPTQRQTLTPLPKNPIEISKEDLSSNLIRGVAGAFAVFMIMGLYISLRKTLDK